MSDQLAERAKLLDLLKDAVWLQGAGGFNYVGAGYSDGSVTLDGTFDLDEIVTNLLAKGVRVE